jgi:DNA-binding NarL/FixJ family response regulator
VVGRRLIVAHADDGFLARVCQHFHRLGWDVYPAHSPEEVRRLAAGVAPSVVLLPTEFPEESGWLTCAKLVKEYPRHKVILVGAYTTPDLQRYTRFVGGSALLGLDSSMRSLAAEVSAAAQAREVN